MGGGREDVAHVSAQLGRQSVLPVPQSQRRRFVGRELQLARQRPQCRQRVARFRNSPHFSSVILSKWRGSFVFSTVRSIRRAFFQFRPFFLRGRRTFLCRVISFPREPLKAV